MAKPDQCGPHCHDLESETKFFAKVLELTISFVKDPNGKITPFILTQDERDRQSPPLTATLGPN